jgi:hypothetical protein
MISRYADGRGLRRYLAGAAAARAGDEMSAPALLLLGFAVTGRPETGSGLLASLTIAGAAGGPLFGALLDRSRRPDRLLAWTLVAYALAPGWLTLAAVALGGVGEGPQLMALFAVRHRETPANLRGQVYTTAASLKIAGLAAGAALAGPLAGWSVTGCLLVAAGTEVCAAAAYLGAGFTGPARPEPAVAPPPGRAGTDTRADRPVRSG